MSNANMLRLLALVCLVACNTGCNSGSSLYDPIGVDEIESGKKPPGLAELGAHVAIVGSIRCYPQNKPEQCFYRAVPATSDAAQRQARGEKVMTFADDAHPFVIVRVKPGAEKEEGFAERAAARGRFTKIALLTYEDQKAFLSLGVSLNDAALFLPDTGSAGVFGWGTMMWPIFAGAGAALLLLVLVAVRVSRGGDRMPGALEASAPPSPTVPPRDVPSPESLSPRASDSLPPGTPVVIRRDNGIDARATVVDAAPGRYLCEVGEGRRAWVTADRVSPA